MVFFSQINLLNTTKLDHCCWCSNWLWTNWLVFYSEAFLGTFCLIDLEPWSSCDLFQPPFFVVPSGEINHLFLLQCSFQLLEIVTCTSSLIILIGVQLESNVMPLGHELMVFSFNHCWVGWIFDFYEAPPTPVLKNKLELSGFHFQSQIYSGIQFQIWFFKMSFLQLWSG